MYVTSRFMSGLKQGEVVVPKLSKGKENYREKGGGQGRRVMLGEVGNLDAGTKFKGRESERKRMVKKHRLVARPAVSLSRGRDRAKSRRIRGGKQRG